MVLLGMQMIPESHLASIGEVVSLHDGVLWNSWRWAGEGYKCNITEIISNCCETCMTKFKCSYLNKVKNHYAHFYEERQVYRGLFD